MGPKFGQQLFFYRNFLVAIANAGVTWVILIIAPLGLFAVIMNTFLVFLASLGFSILGDRLLQGLLASAGLDLIQPKGPSKSLGDRPGQTWSGETLTERKRRYLPKDNG
ncbi:CRISPR-associated protein Csx18 [Picosynechococcus sp. NKBG15041c]|uniref:CRISPR-associated protein Csx18 n=1 Tax=Picosynechococcus sp. NKBG15041c TaxID=1407650 RepID=UPI000406A389|nr:CRISPR-associated protein Csx18 [Picosynechococcus sp. NKBG15041c]